MKNLLLTGGSGFVGSHLKSYLEKNYQVFAPSSRDLDPSDFLKLESFLKENNIDLVIHSANHSDLKENNFYINLQMCYNLEKLSDKVEKILYFGSGAEFDKRLPLSMVKESDFGRSVPVQEYGFYKYIFNQRARSSKNIYNLRLFGIYGWGEDYLSKFISNLCAKAVFDLPLTIRQDCLFDFLYIDDLFPVVDYALEQDLKYHDYNVSTGIPVKLTEIAKMVQEISGKELGITVLNAGMNLEYTADCSRLTEEMSFQCRTLEEGLRALYGMFLEYRESLDYEKIKESK